MKHAREVGIRLRGKRGTRRSVVLLVLVGLLVQGLVGLPPAKAEVGSAGASRSFAQGSNSRTPLAARSEVAPNRVLCDISLIGIWRRTAFEQLDKCPKDYKPADLERVFCYEDAYKGNDYRGITRLNGCSKGESELFPETPNMDCLVTWFVKFRCDSPLRRPQQTSQSPKTTTTIRPTATSTTVAGSTTTQSFAGEYCGGKLSKLKDDELTTVFSENGGGIVGLTAGKVPDWEDVDRCRSAEILHRLSKDWKDGVDKSENPCTPRPKEERFFPANNEKGWFFSKLVPIHPTADDGKCQGIKRLVKNCPKAKKELPSDLILKVDQTELLKLECTYSPDGRLVVENIAPIWEVKKEAQFLKQPPGIGVTAKSNTLKGHQVALPANGCLTQKKNSDCKPNAYPLELTEDQKNIINKANGLLGAIYGKTPGLAGINQGLKLGGQTVTFDCVSLAIAVGAKVPEGQAKDIYDDSESFNWKSLETATWENLQTILPIGSLISTPSHVTVVVGYLERAKGGFFPIVVEAENNLSGVVRAKVEDTSSFGKKVKGGKFRVFKGD